MTADASELRNLAYDLRKAPGQVQNMARMAVEKTAYDIQADAKTMAPVRTGNLKNSISVGFDRGDGAISAEIGPTANYGGFVELGTSRQAPQPYMKPALARREPSFIKAMESIGGRLL